MKSVIISVIAVLFTTSLFAGPKEDLANAFENYWKSRQFDKWNTAVDQTKKLADDTKDKILIEASADLWGANAKLVNGRKILSAICGKIDTKYPNDLFSDVASKATKAKAALEKEKFLWPSKRDARAVLLKLADFISEATAAGEELIQGCKVKSLDNAFQRAFKDSPDAAKFLDSQREVGNYAKLTDDVNGRLDEWNLAVGNATKDSNSKKFAEDLSRANGWLVNLYRILARDCLRSPHLPYSFGKIRAEADRVKAETNPYKGREVLAKLAGLISSAAWDGEFWHRQCLRMSDEVLRAPEAKRAEEERLERVSADEARLQAEEERRYIQAGLPYPLSPGFCAKIKEEFGTGTVGYKKASLRYHPDKCKGPNDLCTEVFKFIGKCYGK